MQDNTFKQELKKAFFTFDENKTSIKKVKFTSIQNTNSILTSLANKKQFSEIRKRYKVHTFLEKVLIKKLLNYILFAYYRNEKMTIAVFHPVGQSELNYKKSIIINYAKQVKEFKDIKEVTIFRYDKLYKFSKDYDEEEYQRFISPFSSKEKKHIEPFFKERSYAIFENKIKDEKLFKKVEEIREIIKNS